MRCAQGRRRGTYRWSWRWNQNGWGGRVGGGGVDRGLDPFVGIWGGGFRVVVAVKWGRRCLFGSRCREWATAALLQRAGGTDWLTAPTRPCAPASLRLTDCSAGSSDAAASPQLCPCIHPFILPSRPPISQQCTKSAKMRQNTYDLTPPPNAPTVSFPFPSFQQKLLVMLLFYFLTPCHSKHPLFPLNPKAGNWNQGCGWWRLPEVASSVTPVESLAPTCSPTSRQIQLSL